MNPEFSDQPVRQVGVNTRRRSDTTSDVAPEIFGKQQSLPAAQGRFPIARAYQSRRRLLKPPRPPPPPPPRGPEDPVRAGRASFTVSGRPPRAWPFNAWMAP